MKPVSEAQPQKEQPAGERLPYETPAIIHENRITTRAGTPIEPESGGVNDSGVDPADLFGG
jgi:hypothetical protein